MAVHSIPVDQRVIDIDSRRFASIEKALVELITNSDESYARLERLFLRLCDEKGLSPAAFDLAIWSSRAK